MKCYHNTAIHLQSYPNTDDDIEMFNYSIDASEDITTAKYAMDKAEEEYRKYLGK